MRRKRRWRRWRKKRIEKMMVIRQRNATSESISNGWAWQSLWEMHRFGCNDDLTAASRRREEGNAVRTVFFYHISHFRCHFILSFQGNFCFYKYVSFTLQHCQQWNVTKSRTKVQRWFWLDQSVIMKRDKGHRLFYMAKTWLREQNTPNEIWNAINIWMRQDHWR